MANVALQKSIEEPIKNPGAATDGEISHYSSNDGFAEFSWPYTMTVDLGDIYRLICLRLLLWDGLGQGIKQRDPRIYRYRLLASSDHLTWNVIYDSNTDGGNGWQVFNFPDLLSARYVRVHGVWNSANNGFQIVQLEAHDSAPPPLNAETMLQRTVLSEATDAEKGDGMPLQASVGRIINRIERLVDKNEQILNPEPFRELIFQLRNQVSDVASLERSMDSIRREIIAPVRHQLDQSGRFSFWGLWVGLIGGVLAILSLAFSLWQGYGQKGGTALHNQSPATVSSPIQQSKPSVISDLESNNNAPIAFSFERRQLPFGVSRFTRQGSRWFQEYPDHRTVSFSEAGRFIFNGCVGTLLARADNYRVEEFVPDKGCQNMEILVRIDRGKWEELGRMQEVR